MGAVTAADRPLLLDTMALVLWYADSPLLGARARSAMLEAPSRTILVSVVSAFEIATKVRIGKLRMPPAVLAEFEYLVEADGFRVLELDASSAVRAGQLASLHRDPFDRLLAAQALTQGCALVTSDTAFEAEFGLDAYW